MKTSKEREQFLEGQRRRHRASYYRHLEENRKNAALRQRKYVAQHRKEVHKRMAKHHQRWTRRNKHFVNAYKITIACRDCGETDPTVLDFDHVRGKKYCRIANMAGQGWSLLTIVKEIAKCEVRCANCHRRKHAKV